MLRLKLEPVPHRHGEVVFVYWEYELDSPYQLCFIPFGALNSFLLEAVENEVEELPREIGLIFEDGRIKIWLPDHFFSDDLFRRIERVLLERLRILFEEAMF